MFGLSKPSGDPLKEVLDDPRVEELTIMLRGGEVMCNWCDHDSCHQVPWQWPESWPPVVECQAGKELMISGHAFVVAEASAKMVTLVRKK
eukprot:GGOE01049193.1.p2 GENE.GGOE01049193.1~~GGOE01049193.1.p2  ORF type:complete len:103 (+),score=29.14 GGOE01049193.1:42-311(+)